MSKLQTILNENITSLITGLKSPQSVARAYKTYLSDKTLIASKMISAIAEAVSTEIIPTGPLLRSPIINDMVDDILISNDIDTNKIMLTATGEVVKIRDVMVNIITEQQEGFGYVSDELTGEQVSVAEAIDGLVDSYQAAKVFESAFAVMETTGNVAVSAISDINTRVLALGLELTSKASETLVSVGDIMSDHASGVIGKISTLSSLITFRSEDITDMDEEDLEPITMPDFDKAGYAGTSPFGAMLQDINFPTELNLSSVKAAIKGTANVLVGAFRKLGNGVNWLWNKTKTWVDDTFIDPIDFQIVNKDSVTHMVDVPFYNRSFSINDIPLGYIDNQELFVNILTKQPIGTLKVTYTPYSVISLYREEQSEFQLIVHAIPSRPIKNKFSDDEDFAHATMGHFSNDNGIVRVESDGINNSATTVYDRYINSGAVNDFVHDGDDDGYYLSAVASSMIRTKSVMEMVSLVWNHAYMEEEWNDMTDADIYELASTSGITDNVASRSIGYKSWLNFNPDNFALFKDALANKRRGNSVTNQDFINIMTIEDSNDSSWYYFLLAGMINDFDFMSEFAQTNPDVPPFLPSVRENEYPQPMYEIVSDSKHGNKVFKFFKGLVIVAIAVTATVIGVKAFLNVKNNMRRQSFALSGLQRQFENMDPNDPSYEATFRNLRKSQKSFNRKNKFLGTMGMGAQRTASGAMVESNALSLDTLIPSNNDVVSLITGKTVK